MILAIDIRTYKVPVDIKKRAKCWSLIMYIIPPPPPPTFIPILAKVCIIYTRLEGYEFMITDVVK